MPFSKNDLTNDGIYLEEKGTLADRIDFAWEAYQNETNTHEERKKALNFLIFAFNIRNVTDLNNQLIALMAERQQYKLSNSEFIPGKSPLHIPIDTKTAVVKQTNAKGHSIVPEINEGILIHELLDVNIQSKKLYKQEKTLFLTPEERAKHRVMISEGLFQKNGKPFDTSKMHSHNKKGFAAYTINANGEISVFIHNRMRDQIAHSSMNAGAPVVAAGELKIKNGVLQTITTHSGHWKRASLMSTSLA